MSDLVMALIEAAYDKDINVQNVICSSLFGLGQKHPALVLSSCNSYLFKQPKVGLCDICILQVRSINIIVALSMSVCSILMFIDSISLRLVLGSVLFHYI